MIDAIQKKIEKIQQLPEHMRMRWVIGCVAVSMSIVLVFWIFSISSMLAEERISNPENNNAGKDSLAEIQDQIEIFKKQASELNGMDLSSTGSIQDIQSGEKNALSNGTSSYEGLSDTNQSKDYSSLPKDNVSE
ncbi:MAG TPA: hypothetical protein PLB52_04115 [Candidatus Moranbacteria bacterium]|nr:hypothetical protein [Candidatus Moranbacteria bacterium]